MSAKIHDGLNHKEGRLFVLKRPIPIGGWFLTLDELESALLSDGWGWGECNNKENKGAVLIAPLILFYWGTSDD